MSDTNGVVHEHVGVASFGNDKPKRNWENANWKIADEAKHVYRVLPPFGTLAASGRWFQYEAVVWGFKGTNGKQRPFRSILKKNRKGMVERPDPVVSWIERMNLERDARIKELKENGDKGKPLTKEEILERVKPMTEMTERYSCRKSFNINVMRQDGQMGRLNLKIRHKQALDALFSRLMNEDMVNPIDPSQGVWVEFSKSGKNREVQFFCNPVYDVIKEGGRTMKSLRPAPLTDDDLARMKNECFDLTMAFRDISEEDVHRLAASKGDPDVVDSVFGGRVDHSPATPAVDFDELAKDDEQMDAEAVMKLTPQKLPVKPTKVLAGFDDDVDF